MKKIPSRDLSIKRKIIAIILMLIAGTVCLPATGLVYINTGLSSGSSSAILNPFMYLAYFMAVLLLTLSHFLFYSKYIHLTKRILITISVVVALIISISVLIVSSVLLTGSFLLLFMASADSVDWLTRGSADANIIFAIIFAIGLIVVFFVDKKIIRIYLGRQKNIIGPESRAERQSLWLLNISMILLATIIFIVGKIAIENYYNNIGKDKQWHYIETGVGNTRATYSPTSDSVWYIGQSNHLQYYSLTDNKVTFESQASFDQAVIATDSFVIALAQNNSNLVILDRSGKELIIPKVIKIYPDKGSSIDGDKISLTDYELRSYGEVLFTTNNASVRSMQDDYIVQVSCWDQKNTKSGKSAYKEQCLSYFKFNFDSSNIDSATQAEFESASKVETNNNIRHCDNLDINDNNRISDVRYSMECDSAGPTQILDKDTGKKYLLPYHETVADNCVVSGAGNYLICNAQYIPFVNRNGFVYWLISEIVK